MSQLRTIDRLWVLVSLPWMKDAKLVRSNRQKLTARGRVGTLRRGGRMALRCTTAFHVSLDFLRRGRGGRTLQARTEARAAHYRITCRPNLGLQWGGSAY